MSIPEPFPTSTTSKSLSDDPAVQTLGSILDLRPSISLLLDLLFKHEQELVVFVVSELELVRDAARESRVVLEELLHSFVIPSEKKYQLSDVVLHLRQQTIQHRHASWVVPRGEFKPHR